MRDVTAEVQQRRRGVLKPKRRKVMVFNQTGYYQSDDETMLSPSKKSDEVRERVISPWTSPYYNLRVVKWSVSPGPAKNLNEDFDAPLTAEDDANPYEDFNSDGSDAEFSLEEKETKEMPVVKTHQVKTPSVSFRELMEVKKRQVQQKDNDVMNDLVEGVSRFFERRQNDDKAPE